MAKKTVVSRWEVTRAVRASNLPAPSRLVMLVLADVAEVGTAEIPERFTPSLNVLASETGLDKSTIRRHLTSLEETGWVIRTRPAPEAARMNGERTRYRLTVPPGCTVPPEVGADSPQPRGTVPLGLGAENHPPRGTEPLPLEAEGPHPRGTVPLIPISSDPPDQNPDQTPSTSVAPHRPDVDKICDHLADRIAANGSKRPPITERWRKEARLMLDKDHRTLDQILRAIDWCQDDAFWRSNILSLPKLREKYDQLRLSAQRGASRASPRSQEMDWEAAMARAQAREVAAS